MIALTARSSKARIWLFAIISCPFGLSLCAARVSGYRITRRSHAAHIEEPGGLRPLTAAPAGPQLLSGSRLPPLFAQPLVTFTVPANLLPQPLVQLFACGLVLRLSDRRVLSSTPPVVGVDLLWVFRPPLRACLGVAGSALGAQPAALLSMSRELRLVFLLPAVAAGLHRRVFRSLFSRKAGAGCFCRLLKKRWWVLHSVTRLSRLYSSPPLRRLTT